METDVEETPGDATASQLEMLDGMRCPYRNCEGVLQSDPTGAWCDTCTRAIVRYD